MADRMIFQIPSRVICGEGCVDQIGQEARQLGASKVLVVTDKNIAAAGLLDEILDSLRKSGLNFDVFDRGEPDPSVDLVNEGTAIVREQKADLLIAVGGGSNIDAAKGISIAATNPRPITDYEGPEKFENQPLPILAVPTTAGTGSEITFFAVITDTQRNYKFLIWSPRIAPRAAFLDPRMVSTAPRRVKVAAGMDALTHAIESFISKAANVYTETCALKAIELIAANFRKMLEDPDDRDSAMSMLIAANIAGFSFANAKLGIVHAMALPLSAIYHIPHGEANSVLLPFGLDFNKTAAAHKYQRMGEALGLGRCEPADVVQAVRQLAADVGAPQAMGPLGVEASSFDKMVSDAMKSGHVAVNPRTIHPEDMMAIYQAAL